MMLDERIYLNDVLFVLSAAESLEWEDLNRTAIQRALYLSAALAPLTGSDWGYHFTNAPYGPFSRELHLAADKLVHYGYAQLVDFRLQADSKLRARYKITDRGSREANRICQLTKERKRLDWIKLVMKVLDIYGATVMSKLASREPTFDLMRRLNRGGVIDLSASENRSERLVQELSIELESQYSIKLDSVVSQLIAYFDFLSSDIG